MRRLAMIGIIGVVTFTATAHAVTPAGAFFRSLIIPGWGQYAIQKPQRAMVFGGVEASLWLSIGWMQRLERAYADDYHGFAAAVSGANVAGKTREYFDNLAFYESRTLHNQVARINDQPDPFLYSIEDDWQWPSPDDRLQFRSRYNDAKKMNRNIDYTVLIMTLNHLASAIDAAKTCSRQHAQSTHASRVSVYPTIDHGAYLVYSHPFK